jgi:hypothetical protein
MGYSDIASRASDPLPGPGRAGPGRRQRPAQPRVISRMTLEPIFDKLPLDRNVRMHERRTQLIRTAKPGRDGTVRVTFALPADKPGGAVSVVGDFNDWDPFAHPLRRRANGTRSAAVTVRAGSSLRFRYLAEDGLWFDDDTVAPAGSHGAAITV